MIVRTYGRRQRAIDRTCSDSGNDVVDDDMFLDSMSQESAPEIYRQPFSSQDSSHLWSLDSELYSSSQNDCLPLVPAEPSNWDNNGDVRKSKKARNGKRRGEETGEGSKIVMFPSTATLMETQECGEMMEHEDEVYFALDGLRKGQPERIQRASLVSLLGICATPQQRRLLRIQGMGKSIVDKLLELNFDDPPSTLAAVTLLFILTNDGQDDHLLESHHCIRFLLRFLKPLVPSVAVKAPSIGSRLAAFRKDAEPLRKASDGIDSHSEIITRKVCEILINCKEIESVDGDDHGLKRPELSSKWVALLALEKACVSKISIEDTTGSVKKSGGVFKERFRELGGLDAVFEIAAHCYYSIEGSLKDSSSSCQGSKARTDLEYLVLLLKCLKIMENATFLSKDNQSHLLEMKRRSDGWRPSMTFIQLVLHVIKILSGLSLLRKSVVEDKEVSTAILGILQAFEDPKVINYKADCNGDVSSSEKHLNTSQNSHPISDPQTMYIISSSDAPCSSANDTCPLQLRVSSSTSGSFSGRSVDLELVADDDDLGFGRNSGAAANGRSKFKDSDDPFAFDEEEFEPSSWDVLSQKNKAKQTHKGRKTSQSMEERNYSDLMMSRQESSNNDNKHNHLHNSFSIGIDKEHSSFIADCLLSAVKVLMNLSNDNPIGCRQIAVHGGLESLSSLIAGHFPFFGSPPPSLSKLSLDHNPDSKNLCDQDINFLVAILGLLVNLIEKDSRNRSQLAATSISLPSSKDTDEQAKTNVIPMLCSIFLANQGAGEAAEEEQMTWNDEAAIIQGEKEAEKMIIEAYSALLLAFLSTDSKKIRESIATFLPDHNLASLVPVLERFVEFHLSLDMISPETHTAVIEMIESCRTL